jgi:hypothetical protein
MMPRVKKRGQPKKAVTARASIAFRVTPMEKRSLFAEAKRNKVTPTSLIRSKLGLDK